MNLKEDFNFSALFLRDLFSIAKKNFGIFRKSGMSETLKKKKRQPNCDCILTESKLPFLQEIAICDA